jgi:hypothetical protein
MSNAKDCMGNTIEVGHWVDILPPPGVKWIGKIVEVVDGGLSLSIDKNQRGVTPTKVRMVLDITLNANPQMPVFPNLIRVVTPQSEELVNKIAELPPSGKPS